MAPGTNDAFHTVTVAGLTEDVNNVIHIIEYINKGLTCMRDNTQSDFKRLKTNARRRGEDVSLVPDSRGVASELYLSGIKDITKELFYLLAYKENTTKFVDKTKLIESYVKKNIKLEDKSFGLAVKLSAARAKAKVFRNRTILNP